MTVNVVTACGKSLINFIKQHINQDITYLPLKIRSSEIKDLGLLNNNINVSTAHYLQQ